MKAVSVGEGYGRVNLIGEHLDYNGGCVLPLQIKNSIICELSENPEIDCISIASDKYQKTLSIEKLEKRDDWADFIIGSCLFFGKKYSIIIKELSIKISSTLPLGIGLSSSAAITVSTLKALNNFYKKNMSDDELIDLAYDIENIFVGVGGGIMDQFASVLGNSKQALYLNTLSRSYELVNIFDDYNFLIIDSNTKRILSNSEFNQKKELCLSAAKKMNLKNLCEKEFITEKDIKLLSDEEFKVCRHVVEENIRVKKAVQFLKDDNPNEFGKLMTESHSSLSEYYGVSTDELNKLVNLSNYFGALGSKLTGAGFGGAVVTLVKNDKVEEFKKMILENYKKAKFV
jgi:galactokinase|tara:strand:- start:731 stop:1762 length:1032 start_codon:yes stop_codon:yes gene_type:complete